jgi:hypothetical protein
LEDKVTLNIRKVEEEGWLVKVAGIVDEEVGELVTVH